MLPEITRPVDLCLPSGALHPGAIGWTRRPLHRANLHPAPLGSRAATWSRTKRREHWGIITDTHVLALTVNALNYAAQQQVWILDRRDGTVVDDAAIVPLARQVELPETPGAGPMRALTRDVAIATDPEGHLTRLRAKSHRVRLDLQVDTTTEYLGVVIPWSERQFQYTLRAGAMPVTGRLEIDGADVPIPSGAWAHVDHGRGRWPYATQYTTAVASGTVAGVRTALHLGGLWTEGTDASENALILDGVLHYLGADAQWEYDVDSASAPWVVEGERLNVRLRPFHHGASATNLGIVATTRTGAVGEWEGWVIDDDGITRTIDGLVGWAEFTSNRW